MPWVILILSGVFEAVWAIALGRSEGFTKVGPTVVFGFTFHSTQHLFEDFHPPDAPFLNLGNADADCVIAIDVRHRTGPTGELVDVVLRDSRTDRLLAVCTLHLLTTHGVGYRLSLGPASGEGARLPSGVVDRERGWFVPDGGAPIELGPAELATLLRIALHSK